MSILQSGIDSLTFHVGVCGNCDVKVLENRVPALIMKAGGSPLTGEDEEEE